MLMKLEDELCRKLKYFLKFTYQELFDVQSYFSLKDIEI